MIQPDLHANTTRNDEQSVFGQLRRAGLIATPSRVAVLQILNAGEMLDAPEIHRRLRQEQGGIPLSSIYAALSRLDRAGLLVLDYTLSIRVICESGECAVAGRKSGFSSAEEAR